MKQMQAYSGCAWAVPRAFGAALHACRFEAGDVLYSDASAYDEKRRSKHPARYHIQVLDPPRAARVARAPGEGQRFFSNWVSPVRFEWMDYRAGRREEKNSSQGGLFTCLWKGDLAALRAGAQGDLPPPLLLRDLQPRLGECAPSIVTRLEAASEVPRRHFFAAAIDQSSDASRVKGQSIERALGAQFAIAVHHFTPAQLELAEADRFHPALEILVVVAACEDGAALEDALREVLYGGGKAAGEEGGRFQLARHGCLLELA